MLLRDLLRKCKDMEPITQEQRSQFVKEYIDINDDKTFLWSGVYSGKSSRKLERLRILDGDDGKALIYVNTKGDLVLVCDPINYTEQSLWDIYSLTNSGYITNKVRNVLGVGILRDKNYYCKVDESYEKYNNHKWKKSRKIDEYLENKKIVFRETTQDDIPALKLLHSAWKSSFERNPNFGAYYQSILNNEIVDGFQYKAYATFYRGVPVLFRYFWEYKGYNVVDFENGITRVLGTKSKAASEYLEYAYSRILNSRREELKKEIVSLKEERNSLLVDRLQFKNRKDWKSVKRIDLKVKEIDDNLLNIKYNWKDDEINEFNKFLKESCTNYNRYKYMETLKTRGIKYYYEDVVGGWGFGPLKKYKEKKNDYTVEYYYYKKGMY